MSQSKFYSQKYRKEWESVPEFKGWLKPVIGDDCRAYCAYCKSDMLAKIYDIRKHCATAKHINKSKPHNPATQSTLPQLVKKVDKCKSSEATMAMAIAEHCSLLACDHLGMACKAAFSDSVAATNFQMHRTKCTEMIRGVLAPYFLKRVTSDVGDEKFSLLLDKSTDVSVSKYLGVVIRYFSAIKRTVVSTFLGLVELEGSDAKSIAKAVVELLKKCNLKKENLHGIGTDKASVMTGVHNGVHKILKEECALPNLVLIHCVCHSLQLAVSAASKETIPRSVEYLIRETYNWFSISPKDSVCHN
ncbi:zinc finger protein 862-like [Anarrhichthys ocellatus]|uniref:zinc finger protein 862-like n=1 Tax=Anarrhichthys ocellatus TaxID=433405 RepID=UPI0012EEC0B5|nr:zinc finger protein 862-like [Anarrhichthys ocellatus]